MVLGRRPEVLFVSAERSVSVAASGATLLNASQCMLGIVLYLKYCAMELIPVG